jgi:UDPglucose 6-dehydrogenase
VGVILGDGFMAEGARKAFGQVPFVWLLEAEVPDGLEPQSIVVVSHPQIVGTTAELEAKHPDLFFAYVPENVREAHPEDWTSQARFVIGCRHDAVAEVLGTFFTPSVVMSPESAEMVKHALNGFLALSIRYAKTIAALATASGADPHDVAEGLMSDPRIGYGAYLNPVGDVSPHLQREVDVLYSLGYKP